MDYATLTMQPGRECWDNLKLILRRSDSSLIEIIPFRDRYTALEVYRQTAVAFYDGHSESLSLNIDNRTYLMPLRCWRAAYSCLDHWFEDYIRLEEWRE